jgi:hypothetical protein
MNNKIIALKQSIIKSEVIYYPVANFKKPVHTAATVFVSPKNEQFENEYTEHLRSSRSLDNRLTSLHQDMTSIFSQSQRLPAPHKKINLALVRLIFDGINNYLRKEYSPQEAWFGFFNLMLKITSDSTLIALRATTEQKQISEIVLDILDSRFQEYRESQEFPDSSWNDLTRLFPRIIHDITGSALRAKAEGIPVKKAINQMIEKKNSPLKHLYQNVYKSLESNNFDLPEDFDRYSFIHKQTEQFQILMNFSPSQLKMISNINKLPINEPFFIAGGSKFFDRQNFFAAFHNDPLFSGLILEKSSKKQLKGSHVINNYQDQSIIVVQTNNPYQFKPGERIQINSKGHISRKFNDELVPLTYRPSEDPKNSKTKDGKKINLSVISSSNADLSQVHRVSNHVGLLRLEFLYESLLTKFGKFPNFMKLILGLKKAITSMPPEGSLDVRLFEPTPDKNKILQLDLNNHQSLRYLIHTAKGQQILTDNIKAISMIQKSLESYPEPKLKIRMIIPNAYSLNELKIVADLVDKQNPNIELIAMIENPAIVDEMDKIQKDPYLAKRFSGFSVGANDLVHSFTEIQNRYSINKGIKKRLKHYKEDVTKALNNPQEESLDTLIRGRHRASGATQELMLNPDFLRYFYHEVRPQLIRALNNGHSIKMCGRLDKHTLLLLIGMDIRDFSLPETEIESMSKLIRKIDASEAKSIVKKVLKSEGPKNVLKLSQSYFDNLKKIER